MRRIGIYQVVEKDAEWSHLPATVDLNGSRTPFYGCVKIGAVRLTKAQIGERLAPPANNAAQGATPILQTIAAQGRGWSCAQWILRNLQEWGSQGLITLTPSDSDAIYNIICKLGAGLREAAEDPDLESVDVDGVEMEITSVNGVPTFDL